MSWPTRTWTVDGWKDFKTPGTSKPTGFPDDWEQHESSVDNSSYWDVIENPLYEAAANASGIDWDQFVADSSAEIGEYRDRTVTVQTSAGGGRVRTGKNTYGEAEPTYRDMTVAEAEEAGYTSEDFVVGVATGGRDVRTGRNTYTKTDAFFVLGDDEDEDAIDWGIDRNEFGSIAEDLDTMHEWLGKTIKTHALQDAPIIRRGPEGSDYGIDGDIWEHYGLDKPPAPPKEMDVNYEFNLITAKPSSKSYATPTGYPQIDTSTESIPGPTSYETYMDLPTDSLISDLYQQHFGREPSEQETQDWLSTGMSASEIETGIVDHPEATSV